MHSVYLLAVHCIIVFLICSCVLFAMQPDSAVSDQNAVTDTIDCSSDTPVLTNTSLSNEPSFVKYTDGIYTGESAGWTGMKVQVKIKHGSICRIKVLKAKGTPEYYNEVVQKLPRHMIRQGNVNVDGISGATLSCNSLKEAVSSALKKAVNRNQEIRIKK